MFRLNITTRITFFLLFPTLQLPAILQTIDYKTAIEQKQVNEAPPIAPAIADNTAMATLIIFCQRLCLLILH